MVLGLRRSKGLHLLNQTMMLYFDKKRFFKLLSWFQSSLRNSDHAKIKDDHCLNGLEVSNKSIKDNITDIFSQIIGVVVYSYKHESHLITDDYVHLAFAMCWNY